MRQREVTIPTAYNGETFYLWSNGPTDKAVLLITGGTAREDYVELFSYDHERNALRDQFIESLVSAGYDVLCMAHGGYLYGAGFGDLFVYYVGKWLEENGYVNRFLFGYSAGGLVVLHKAIYPGNADEFMRLGDVNMDGVIDQADIQAIGERFGCEEGMPCYEYNYDLNGDRKIDILDVSIAAKNVGLKAPAWNSAVCCSAPCDWDSHLSYDGAPSAEIFQTAHLAEKCKLPVCFIAPVEDFTHDQMLEYFNRDLAEKKWFNWTNGHDVFPNTAIDGTPLNVAVKTWMLAHEPTPPRPRARVISGPMKIWSYPLLNWLMQYYSLNK